MYQLSLKRLPENGAYAERALHLSREELGLAEPFDAAGAEVSYELRRILDKVFGSIRAQTQVHLQCSRCLTEFDQVLKADFQIQFEPPTAQPREGEEDVDADEDRGLSVATYTGEELPVGEEIRQELELQVPFAPQCRKDCKGLCPRCGQNWNDGDCDCPKGPEGGVFSGLNELLQKKKDPERG
jgi:uncharacterized protein